MALATKAPVVPLAQWGAQDVIGPYAKEFKVFPRKTMHVRAGARMQI